MKNKSRKPRLSSTRSDDRNFIPHPVIRVACLLVAGAALSLGGASQLWAAVLALLVLYRILPVSPRDAWPLLRRLKIFFLSIFVVYLWFTPGEPLLAMALLPRSLIPTDQGLLLGISRIAVLVAIALCVHLLLATTSREELLGAIHWLARPLSRVGVSHERLAVRMTLTLEYVGSAQTLLSLAKQQRRAHTGFRGMWRSIAQITRETFQQIVERGNSAPTTAVNLPEQAAPAMLQWGYPLALAIGFFALP